jgi:hypothetical protein
MAAFQADPVCPTFDTRDPAGRVLIIAADLSTAREPGRTQADRPSERAGRLVLADCASEVAADVAIGPREQDGIGSCYRCPDRQVGGRPCARKSDNRKYSSPDNCKAMHSQPQSNMIRPG